MKWLNTPTEARGFTLVELLIAMVILAIGIMATMAMQFSALAGYNSARDATGATEMAKTVEQIIQTEARGWKAGDSPPGGAQDPYGEDSNYFAAAFAGGGEWTRANEEPKTVRRNTDDTDDGTNRFCVYVAAGEVEDDVARVAIAVVYPAARGSFDDPTQCPDLGSDELDTGNRQDLELMGLRSTHLTTAVGAMPADD